MNEFVIHAGIQQVVKRLDDSLKHMDTIDAAAPRINEATTALTESTSALAAATTALANVIGILADERAALVSARIDASHQIRESAEIIALQYEQTKRLANTIRYLANSSWTAFVLTVIGALCVFLKR